MLGKTHMAVGVAATLAVLKPETLPELVLATGGGALGAVISDIDVGSGGGVSRDADRVIALAAAVIAAVFAADYFLHTNIISGIVSKSGYVRVVGGILLFLGICAFGKEQPHRSFMHSFLALFLLCAAMGLVWGKLVLPFAVGFLSHLATDIFNKRKVRLLYPLQSGISLNLFSAKGIANTVFFAAGSAVAIAEVMMFAVRYLGR